MTRLLKIEEVCDRLIDNCSECPLMNYDEIYDYKCGLMPYDTYSHIGWMFASCPLPEIKYTQE